MSTIVSASRRTDIPAFYAEWFLRRLDAGSLHVRQPFNGRIFPVSLKAEDVGGIVFWSKNMGPLLPHLERVERTSKNLFFQFTITGVPREFEPFSPPVDQAVEDMLWLSRRYGPERIVWRFDPIVLTDRIPFDHYRERFAAIGERLRACVTDCTISFACLYKKVSRNFARRSEHRLEEIATATRAAYARELAARAENWGMRLAVCCDEEIAIPSVYKAACVNGNRLAALSRDENLIRSPAPTRKGCGCTKSIDIGAYDSCGHGCLYCYANSDPEKARRALTKHRPDWTGLNFEVSPGDGER